MQIRQRKILLATIAFILSLTFASESLATKTVKVPDNTTTLNVEEALGNDARVDASEITVSVRRGIVTLSGNVTNIASRKYADMEAKKINGVLGVINKIEITPTWRSDIDIVNAIQRRILNSAAIESNGIIVVCSGGKVALSGSVKSWSERQEATLLASEVRGVKEVVDNLSTKWTKKRDDQAIKNDVVAKLARDVYLEALPIEVKVKSGVVTLSGNVGSAFEKDRAHNAVRGISNVAEVKNNLEVEYWQDYGTRTKRPVVSDSDLKRVVRQELQADSRVNASDIDVAVSRGSVTLKGTVASRKAKTIAEQDAKDVIGVAWVSNKLFARVDKRENWAVREDVIFNLNTDALTEGFDLGVKVKDGRVTLSGTVNTWYERSHAGDVASRVKGVKDVINQIGVDTRHPATATEAHPRALVVNAIKNGLRADGVTKWVSSDIGVSVEKGVATLTGEVDTWHQRAEAANVAYTTKGVWEVRNKLSVAGYDYEWDDYDYYDGPYPYSYYGWYEW